MSRQFNSKCNKLLAKRFITEPFSPRRNFFFSVLGMLMIFGRNCWSFSRPFFIEDKVRDKVQAVIDVFRTFCTEFPKYIGHHFATRSISPCCTIHPT